MGNAISSWILENMSGLVIFFGGMSELGVAITAFAMLFLMLAAYVGIYKLYFSIKQAVRMPRRRPKQRKVRSKVKDIIQALSDEDEPFEADWMDYDAWKRT